MKRRTSFYSQDDYEEAPINLTPLIDVVFVVLIMFILIAPLLEQERISLATAGHKETISNVHKPSSLTIHVRADNSILLNGSTVSLKELALLLKQKKSSLVIPHLFQDKNSSFGTYQDVKNIIEEAGFDEVELILKP